MLSGLIQNFWRTANSNSMVQYHRELESGKARLLHKQSGLSLAISLVNGCILGIIEWSRVAPSVVIAWITSLIIVTAVRAFLINNLYDENFVDPRWTRVFGYGVFSSGLVWGSAGYLFFAGNDPVYLSFVIFILAGMTAGSVVVLASVRYMPGLYIIPSLMPLAACFVEQGDFVSMSMGLLVCFYALVLMLSGEKTFYAIEQSLILGIQNKELLEVVSNEKQRVDEINNELSSEVRMRAKAQQELKNAAKLLSQKNAELDLALKKAEQANEAKSNFLAATSHEIRTPMTAILGITDLMLETDLKDEQRGYLKSIKEAAGFLMVIINDVLDFAKIEAGKLEILNEKISLPKLLDEVVQLFKVTASEMRHDVLVSYHGEIPDFVVTDPARLRQVLVNLFGNAIKFTSPQGVIICYVEGKRDAAGNLSVFFSVSDTGIGIRSDMVEKIFESFTQAEKYTTRLYGGTGLGLTISNRIVSLMGGVLKVKSLYGFGSQFYFTIPMGVAENDVGSLEKVTHIDQGIHNQSDLDLSILLVEDNSVNQKLFEAILNKFGCNVQIVCNGQEALKSLAQSSFDLVLMDCQMPIMDGYEATRMIRAGESSNNRRIPIVALTAHALETDRRRCLDVGMDDYLSKPIDRNKLYQTLARYSR